jgi:glycosyltransferase involved in cell wall biosynthesis
MSKVATILVALYKAGQFLESKIKSLEKQTLFDRCNIVLLNCQNLDNEADIYKDFLDKNDNVTEIRYDEHVRLYPTWNDGILATDSTYIMNSNVDDQLHPQYVEACSEYLDKHTQFCCVSTGVLLTYQPNQVWPQWESQGRLPYHAYPASTAGPCPLWRRSLHDKYGYFGNYRVIGDARIWEAWYDGKERFGLLQRDLALYYAHADSLERRVDEKGRGFRNLDISEDQK